MSEIIPVSEFERRLSDYIDRVANGRECFVLERGGKAIAEIRPAREGLTLGELPAVLASAPHLTQEEADAFARDIEQARKELPKVMPRDPWER